MIPLWKVNVNLAEANQPDMVVVLNAANEAEARTNAVDIAQPKNAPAMPLHVTAIRQITYAVVVEDGAVMIGVPDGQ